MALLCATTLVFAQNSTQTALLQHGDEITTFYGADAFISAEAAATTGDIITLSSGTFNAPEILDKSITLRGVGCVTDDELDIHPTTIAGNIKACVTDSNEKHLTVEGVFFDGVFQFEILRAPVFIKCNFEEIKWNGGSTEGSYDSDFINCRIKWFRSAYIQNTTFHNCVVYDSRDGMSAGESFNTIIAYNSVFGLYQPHNNLFAYNSVVYGNGMKGNSVAHNCIARGAGIIAYCSYYDCWVYEEFRDIFETFEGPAYDGNNYVTESFRLNSEVANQCLGQDGTQVGIYGGNMPYSTRPTYMTNYRTTVGQHSTPDGKLNIHIEVIDGNK